jgi:hypothetical protein
MDPIENTRHVLLRLQFLLYVPTLGAGRLCYTYDELIKPLFGLGPESILYYDVRPKKGQS